MSPIDITVERIDEVLRINRRIEWAYTILTVLLFAAGISCVVTAIVTREFAWTIPPIITTAFLYFPLREIRDVRRKNIALATTPFLVSQLPDDKAAEQIQRLLEQLRDKS